MGYEQDGYPGIVVRAAGMATFKVALAWSNVPCYSGEVCFEVGAVMLTGVVSVSSTVAESGCLETTHHHG
jgi:hypothetical protein